MKNMKKLASLLLALVMVFSLATTAFAASITITPPTVGDGAEETGITYKAYKIFDATITYNDDGSIKSVSYTIDSESPYYTTIAGATDYFTLTQVTGTNTYVVEKKDAYTDSVANTFADTLKAVTATAAGTLTKQADGTYKLDNLADGYYLVTSSVGSDLILDTIGDISIATKNEYPSQDKKVEGKDDYTTADKGGTVNFTIDVTIPEDAVGVIVVHDTMTGLEYQSMTAVDGQTAVTNNLTDGCAVEFTLSDNYVAANKGKIVTIAYTAKLTADVANNESWIVDDTYTSAHDDVDVYSTDIVINKVISGTTTPLAGAKFVLKNTAGAYYKVDNNGNVTWYALTKDDPDTDGDETETLAAAIAAGNVTEVTTDTDGKAEFTDIADGTYYLVETEAPAGYNLLTEPKSVTVTAVPETENGTTTVADIVVDVENSSGTELPSTGGMGTTLFYVFGGILVAAAVVLLVTKKRMSAAE